MNRPFMTKPLIRLGGFSLRIGYIALLHLVVLSLVTTGLLLAGTGHVNHWPDAATPSASWIASSLDPDVAALSAPEFRIDSYRVDLSIGLDGSAQVAETVELTYLSDSQVTRFDLSRGEASVLTVQKVAISAASGADRGVSMLEISPADSSKQANSKTLSYTLNINEDRQRLSIHSPAVSGVTRVLRVNYLLQDVLERHQDAVVFQRPLFTSFGKMAIGQPIAMLTYPADAKQQPIWYTPIAASSFLAVEVEPGTVQMSSTVLPAGQSMTAVLLLPVTTDWETLPLMAEPRTRADLEAQFNRTSLNASRQGDRSGWLGGLVTLLLAAALLVLILLSVLFDREGLMQNRKALPLIAHSAFRPAMLARLIRPRHPGQLVLGTMLDLVRRGVLRLDGHVFSTDEAALKHYPDMTAYEIFLVQWLFERVTRETTLSIAQIRKYALDRRSAHEYSAYYEQLVRLVDEELQVAGLIDPAKKSTGQAIGLTLGAAFFAIALVLVLAARSPSGWFLMIPSASFLLFGLACHHLTREGYRQADLGLAFRKTLRQIQRQSGLSPDQAAANLPHAVALGLVSQYMDRISMLYGKDPQRLRDLLRRYTHSLVPGEPVIQLKAFARDLEAMDSMLSASLYLTLGIHFNE